MMSLLILRTAAGLSADLDAALTESGLTVRVAADAEAALSLLAERDSIVIADLLEPAAADQLRLIKGRRPRTLAIAAADPKFPGAAAELARREVVIGLLPRPLSSRSLVAALTRFRLALGAEEEALPTAPLVAWGIFGSSPRMLDVIKQIEKAGAQHGGVTISGEHGTGRGLVARAIHACSRPADAPFVAVYCEHVDLTEIEALLFGSSDGNGQSRQAVGDNGREVTTHERLAPGALLDRARGGTLYFRHLEELPDRVQARLAHVFRDREVVMTDGDGPEPFDVRPISAVDDHFQAALDEGRVRPDLHKRFAGMSITIPPLRERREDIPALAEFFVERVCRQAGIPPKTLTPSSEAVLSALPWKGNASELESLLEVLVMKTESEEVGLEALLAHVRLDGAGFASGHIRPTAVSLRDAREQFEKEYITAVLAQHHGRVQDAASALGIQRTNLYRKLRTLHLAKHGRAGTPWPAETRRS